MTLSSNQSFKIVALAILRNPDLHIVPAKLVMVSATRHMEFLELWSYMSMWRQVAISILLGPPPRMPQDMKPRNTTCPTLLDPKWQLVVDFFSSEKIAKRVVWRKNI